MDWILSSGIYLAYGLFLLAFLAYSLAALYHLKEFGFVGDACRLTLIIYIVLASFAITLSLVLLLRI